MGIKIWKRGNNCFIFAPAFGKSWAEETGGTPGSKFLKKVSKKFRKDFAEQKSGIIFADAFPQKFWGFLEAKKVL